MWKPDNDTDAGMQQTSGTLTAYREAVKEFSENATGFLEHIPHFAKAWDAYERAMAASTQLRTTLDQGDETLRTLMSQMEQVITRVANAWRLDTKTAETVSAGLEKKTESHSEEADRKKPEAVLAEMAKAS